MCGRDYLSADIENLTSACPCFLHDMHDPTSCTSGLIFMYSNFGAGQDPWLVICVFALALYCIGLFRAVFNPDLVGQGDTIFENKVFGRFCFGGGILGCTICQTFQRIIFITVAPPRSRLLNVAFSGWFNCCLSMMVFGLTSCWWKELSNELEPGQDEESNYSGIYLKSLRLLKPRLGKRVTLFLSYLSRALELFLLTMLSTYVVSSMLFAANHKHRKEGSRVQKVFLFSANFYSTYYVWFLMDAALAIVLHYYLGKRDSSERKVGMPQITTRANFSNFGKVETSLLLKVLSVGIFGTLIHKSFLSGYCPYVAAEDDFAHGGDPWEYPAHDVTIFASLFFVCLFLIRRVFKGVILRLRSIDFEASTDEQLRVITFGHPNKRRIIAFASILSNGFLAVVGVCLLIAQQNIPTSQVITRIFFLSSIFVVESLVGDQRLALMVLDGRLPFQHVFQAIVGTMLVSILVLYIWQATYFETLDRHGGGNIIGSDLALLLVVLISITIKRGLVFLYGKLAVRHGLLHGDRNDIESSLSPTDHNHVAQQGNETPSERPTRNNLVRLLTLFTDLLRGFTSTLVVLFFVWNALALVLALFVVSRIVRMILREIWARKDHARGREHVHWGFFRKSVSFFAQVLSVITVFFLLQIVYLLVGPLPYNERQVLIAGHRGVWTKGYAENSLEAFDYAKNAGFHAVEFDLQLTKDRQLVVLHDKTLERTTTGTGYVADYTLEELQKLSLTREETKEIVSEEFPYSIDQIIQESMARGFIMNFDTKPGPRSDLLPVPLVLDAICRNNATQVSFIAAGEPRFHHLLYHLEPRISIQRDFLFYTPTMALLASPNVNVVGVSAELLLFNPWIISNMHRADKHVFLYFLAIETPFFLQWFVRWGVDMVMINNPADCLASGLCKPQLDYKLDRTIPV